MILLLTNRQWTDRGPRTVVCGPSKYASGLLTLNVTPYRADLRGLNLLIIQHDVDGIAKVVLSDITFDLGVVVDCPAVGDNEFAVFVFQQDSFRALLDIQFRHQRLILVGEVGHTEIQRFPFGHHLIDGFVSVWMRVNQHNRHSVLISLGELVDTLAIVVVIRTIVAGKDQHHSCAGRVAFQGDCLAVHHVDKAEIIHYLGSDKVLPK